MGICVRSKSNKQYFDVDKVYSFQGINDKLNEINININSIEGKILQIMAATPKDLISDTNEQGTPLEYINEVGKDLLAELSLLYAERDETQRLLDTIEQWNYTDPFNPCDIYNKKDLNNPDDFAFICCTHPASEKDKDISSYLGLNEIKDLTLDDVLDNSLENFLDHHVYNKELADFYLLYYKGVLLTDEYGDYHFKSEEEARKYLYRLLNFEYGGLNKVSNFITNNSQLINELIQHIPEQKDKDMFISLIDKIKKEGEIKDIQVLTSFHEYMSKGYYAIIGKDIKVVKFRDIYSKL